MPARDIIVVGGSAGSTGALTQLPGDLPQVEKDHVYVAPPNAQLLISNGKLRLAPRPSDRTQYNPIDAFLHSLAAVAQDRAIAVIMSGTASDGTSGVREVKAVGGTAIVQRPDTAKYDGMPRAAIATGLVDLVLSPGEIAATLVQMGRHPFARRPQEADDRDADDSTRAHQFERILTILRNATGVDFRLYKQPTIERRVHRRMVLHRLPRLRQYVRYLEDNPAEIQALFQDILILVTRFFRDPEAFEAIRNRAIPAILENHKDDEPIRIWDAGCSTGEEAYSIGILFIEYLSDRGLTLPIHIFATDISDKSIEHARNGVYPAEITADVSPVRLRRFFTKCDGGYRVSKAVRDSCVFARQDLTRDPPFSKMDLIVCRNVLIYLNASVQQKLMQLFHYALKPHGFLMLGTAETIGQHSDLFRSEDKRYRLYGKRPVATSHGVFPGEYTVPLPLTGRSSAPPARDDARSVQNEANRLVQERYAPAGVIVDSELQIVQFRGHTGAYLEPAPGDPSNSLMKMCREGLLHGLRTTLQAARRGNAAARRDGLRVRQNGLWNEVAVEVVPLTSSERPHYLVLFHPGGSRPAKKAPEPPPPPPRRRTKGAKDDEKDLERLRQELASSREYLQSIIQELEAANEELQSANEEVLSANEELQSTNEELDTAKEELQSTNEELNTVNDELRGRNEELSRANSDLENLLASVQIAIVIVARDLRIRRFTPMAEKVLNLIPSDLGRPIGHIKPNIECSDLESRILTVLNDVAPQEAEVSDGQGNRYSLRIRPYKDIENKIDGAVLALFDLDRHGASPPPPAAS
jgi:two-component system CheB/CheR fusion protein